MFKHQVTYVDFNGSNRTEDLYFHLSLPELTRIEAEIGTSLEEHIKQLQDNKDLKTLLNFLETILLNSYGQKTMDGRSFTKNESIRSAFENSQAYAEIFEQVLTDAELAKRFGTSVADNGKKRNTPNVQAVAEQQ